MLKKLELLLKTPSDYRDYNLSKTLQLGSTHIIKVEVLSIDIRRFLRVNVLVKQLNIDLTLLFFNYSKYHINLFKLNKTLFLEGKIEERDGFIMIQPKEVVESKIGSIELKYRNSKILDDIRLIIKSLDFLPTKISKALDKIYNPSSEFVQNYHKNRGFFGVYLESLKFLESFLYILKLKSKKLTFFSTNTLTNSPNEFIKSLPFQLTDDQKKALDDIQKDLSSTIATKRLIIGDVGSGKTILILASATIAYPNISILMAPTTILANQIYEEAKRFLPKEIKVVLYDRDDIELNDYHFIISTHKLLYTKLPKADLIMVDEQHRFGVNQRKELERLTKFSKNRPHYLQFSATPIPRTKALLDANLINFSFLKESPFKKDIHTEIITNSNFSNLLEHIKREVEQFHQVVIVYPLVTQSESINYLSIEEAKEFWQSRFSSVYVTFGKDKNKDEVIEEFREKGSILLATTLIEVGISLPKLSTIVISGAERLGFASLHQLRGRVARNGLKGYCFLYSKKPTERLKEFIKTTNGFEIAELDLKYRDFGDILDGKNQSGKSFKFLNLLEDEFIIKEAQEFSKTLDSGEIKIKL